MTLTFAGDRINVHYCVRQWQVVVSVSRAHNAVYRQQVFAIGRCYATGAPGGYATGGELVPARGSHSAVHAATCTTARAYTAAGSASVNARCKGKQRHCDAILTKKNNDKSKNDNLQVDAIAG